EITGVWPGRLVVFSSCHVAGCLCCPGPRQGDSRPFLRRRAIASLHSSRNKSSDFSRRAEGQLPPKTPTNRLAGSTVVLKRWPQGYDEEAVWCRFHLEALNRR